MMIRRPAISLRDFQRGMAARMDVTRRDVLCGLAALGLSPGAKAGLLPLGGASKSGIVFVPQSGFSATGTWQEGQLVTITGPTSSLGSIGPQLLWAKYFANETAGSRVANGPDFIASSLVTSAANGNGPPYCASGSGMPYSKGMIVSNDSRVGTVSTGAGWGGFKLTLSALISELAVTGTFYFPSSCNYSPLISAGNPQLKTEWAYANSISDTDLYDKICNQAIALAFETDSDTATAIDGLAFGGNTNFAWGSGPALKTGVPIKRIRWAQLNASPGSGKGNILWVGCWDGTSQSINVYHNGLVMAASGSANNGYNTINVPGFVQYTTATSPNWSYDNNAYIIQGDISIKTSSSGNAGAIARLELGDAPTYAGCTKTAEFAIESPSWWSASSGQTQVQARIRSGVFYQGMVGAYVYATDSNNNTSFVGRLQTS